MKRAFRAVLVVALLAMAFAEAFLVKVVMANFTPNEIEYSASPISARAKSIMYFSVKFSSPFRTDF